MLALPTSCSEEYELQLQQHHQQQQQQQQQQQHQQQQQQQQQQQHDYKAESHDELVQVRGGLGDMPIDESELDGDDMEGGMGGLGGGGGDDGNEVATVKVEYPLSPPTLQTGLSHVSLPAMDNLAASTNTPYTISISLPAQDIPSYYILYINLHLLPAARSTWPSHHCLPHYSSQPPPPLPPIHTHSPHSHLWSYIISQLKITLINTSSILLNLVSVIYVVYYYAIMRQHHLIWSCNGVELSCLFVTTKSSVVLLFLPLYC